MCWSHFRRRFYSAAKKGSAPMAKEALAWIGVLCAVEDQIRDRCADGRRTIRQTRMRSLVKAL
ncbi:MAG: transposase [Proteobacteria bacterium]|nr:transposase [Pseudomonadota bacterium]